jgi:hypothetical protein
LPGAVEPLMDGRRTNARTKSQLLLSSRPGPAMQNHQCCPFIVVSWWASPWFPSSMLITPCRWLLCCTLLLQVWYTSTCLHVLNQCISYFFYSKILLQSLLDQCKLYLPIATHLVFWELIDGHVPLVYNPKLSMYSSKINILLVFIKFILLKGIRNYYL